MTMTMTSTSADSHDDNDGGGTLLPRSMLLAVDFVDLILSVEVDSRGDKAAQALRLECFDTTPDKIEQTIYEEVMFNGSFPLAVTTNRGGVYVVDPDQFNGCDSTVIANEIAVSGND